jgi:hypothetical protein
MNLPATPPASLGWVGEAMKNYGFPILVACYLLYQQQLTTKFLQDKVEKHDVEVIRALEENTKVIAKNTEVIQQLLLPGG